MGRCGHLVAFGRGVNAAAFEDTVSRVVGTAKTDEAALVESGPPVPPGSVTTGLVAFEALFAPAVEFDLVEGARIRLAAFSATTMTIA